MPFLNRYQLDIFEGSDYSRMINRYWQVAQRIKTERYAASTLGKLEFRARQQKELRRGMRVN